MRVPSPLRTGSPHAVGDRGLLWITRPAVLGVTVLTSMDKADLADVGITSDLREEVVRLATLARDCGLDGIVASPHEIRLIRERIAAKGFIVLTPGIRPAWSAKGGDQKRIATPAAQSSAVHASNAGNSGSRTMQVLTEACKMRATGTLPPDRSDSQVNR